MIHYARLHALLTQGSPINVRVFQRSTRSRGLVKRTGRTIDARRVTDSVTDSNAKQNRYDNLSTNRGRYGQQISSISVCDRPNHLRCASSIAAADWDTHRIPFTTKTSRGKKAPRQLRRPRALHHLQLPSRPRLRRHRNVFAERQRLKCLLVPLQLQSRHRRPANSKSGSHVCSNRRGRRPPVHPA